MEEDRSMNGEAAGEIVEDGSTERVVVVLADLFFASKVRALAAPIGIRVVVRSRPTGLIDVIRAEHARLVLVDLELRSPDLLPILREIAALPDLDGVRLVGFASHMNRAAFDAAREAGVAEAMARSAFVRELPALLSSIPVQAGKGPRTAPPGAR
jgi:DNA-binding NarL/FixJ family response regulator